MLVFAEHFMILGFICMVSHLWEEKGISRKIQEHQKVDWQESLSVEADEELKTIIWSKTGGWAGSPSDQKDNQRAFRMYQIKLSKL